MTNLKPCKIVIIEPSPVIQQGLKVLIEAHPEFIVQNVCCDFPHFQKCSSNYTADVILINPSILEFYNKSFSIRNLFSGYTKAVFVAILYKYVHSGILQDFDGVVDIYDESPSVVEKLLTILKTNSTKNEEESDENQDLSDREKEILASVAKGLTNKEIADKHCISIHTVVTHRKNITRKTGIKTVSGLTIYAMFNNLVVPEDLR